MDTDIDTRAGRVNPAEKEKNNEKQHKGREDSMKKPIFRTWDYNAIPWYMFDEDMYTIEEVRYEDDFDLVLAGSVEYLVYLN